MSKIERLKISKNKIILTIFILLVCVIYSLPHIIMSAELGKNYTPFSLSSNSPIASDETYGYAGFANYIYGGHTLLKDAYVYEYRNFPTPLIADNIPAIAYAILAIVSGSIEKAYIVSDFIFPAILFLMIYLFVKMFVKSNYFALATAFITVISRDLISVIPYPVATYRYLTFADYQDTFLHLSRSPHPQFSLIVLFATFWLFIRLVSKPSRNPIIPGIFFGLLFYTYMFYFSYFSLFFVLLFVFFALKKEKLICKKLFKAGIIAAAVAAYYFWNVLNFYRTDLAFDFAQKLSRPQFAISPTLLRYALIGFLLLLTLKKKGNRIYVFSLFLLTGVVVIPLIRLISQRDFDTFHYVRFILMPFSTIAFLIVAYHLLKTRKIIVNLISALVIAIGLFLGFKTQIYASLKVVQYHRINTEQKQVFDWLNTNSQKDDVVASLNDDFNRFTSVYTRNWVYFPFTSRTIMPTSESAYRFIVLSNLLGISKDEQKASVDSYLGYIFRFRSYDDANNLDKNSQSKKWLVEEIDMLSTQNAWQSIVDNYKLDYIVVTPDELKIIKPNLQYLTFMTSINSYLIFRKII